KTVEEHKADVQGRFEDATVRTKPEQKRTQTDHGPRFDLSRVVKGLYPGISLERDDKYDDSVEGPMNQEEENRELREALQEKEKATQPTSTMSSKAEHLVNHEDVEEGDDEYEYEYEYVDVEEDEEVEDDDGETPKVTSTDSIPEDDQEEHTIKPSEFIKRQAEQIKLEEEEEAAAEALYKARATEEMITDEADQPAKEASSQPASSIEADQETPSDAVGEEEEEEHTVKPSEFIKRQAERMKLEEEEAVAGALHTTDATSEKIEEKAMGSDQSQEDVEQPSGLQDEDRDMSSDVIANDDEEEHVVKPSEFIKKQAEKERLEEK
ncbi:MAG: hypothetical protein IH840_09990, partial [Candidatus Heimdallarchaeota archaeon]|nr:hypothetical protein [Candidatus Heimdallarchaeota archaeon]